MGKPYGPVGENGEKIGPQGGASEAIGRKSFIDRSAVQLEVCGRSGMVAYSGTSQSVESSKHGMGLTPHGDTVKRELLPLHYCKLQISPSAPHGGMVAVTHHDRRPAALIQKLLSFEKKRHRCR